MTEVVIGPPACIGMLGGGQLGRYALMAARRMGYRTMVLDPSPYAPAGAVADIHLQAAYDDEAALDALAAQCAVVTAEFENPPAASLARLSDRCRVVPSAMSFAIAQDRIAEKTFLGDLGVPVAPWTPVTSADTLPDHVGDLLPGLLKTARLGYDGHGQRSVTSVDELRRAFANLGGVPCVLEQRLPLTCELSVVLARDVHGAVATYPLAENLHRNGILDTTLVPARVDHHLAHQAVAMAEGIARGLDHVGVLAVELFVVEGSLLVNELAPRPHNSGHWTLDAARTDQFTQQLRTAVGVPPGPTALTAPAVAMVNLLGDLWHDGEPDWSTVLNEPTAHLHLYGKHEARPGRKMGHLTVVGDQLDAVTALATALRNGLQPRH